MSRSLMPFVLLGALPACGGLELLTAECAEADKIWAYVDEDGDGAGTSTVGRVCRPAAGQATVAGDCDDGDADANPDAEEVCDRTDNDCDGTVDEELPVSPYFHDADDDGFGDVLDAGTEACGPGPRQVADHTDCDDGNVEVNPGAPEVCGGLDDDCDGFVDDADPDIDPAVLTSWYRDSDGDGFGDDTVHVEICAQPAPAFTAQGGDCNDLDLTIHPSAPELCNLTDDDCDLLVDELDPDIDPALLVDTWSDVDGDGYGDPASLVRACFVGPGRVTNGLDCADGDPSVTASVDWVVDSDLDGVGAGAVVATACSSPGVGHAPASAGADCDDGDPGRFPGLLELCGDGLDQDCNGVDLGCGTWLYSVRTVDNMLVRVDGLTFAYEPVGVLGAAFDFGDLAYDQGSGTLYMIDGWGGRGLYRVDLVTGAATLIGIHNVTSLFGLAWDPTTDTLYATASAGSSGLYTLDQTTGAATWLGNPYVGIDGLAWDSLRGQLIGMYAGPGYLYTIDRANGLATYLSESGFVNNCGLAYDPQGDLYWVMDWSGYVFTYDPANAWLRTVVLASLGSHDGFVYVPNPPN